MMSPTTEKYLKIDFSKTESCQDLTRLTRAETVQKWGVFLLILTQDDQSRTRK